MTKKSLILLAAACVAGCDLGLDGNGERAEEVREVSEFHKVRCDSELDVQLVQGDEQRVVLSLDSNLLEHVRTHVDNGTLYIDTDDNLNDVVRGPHVLVAIPALSAIKLAGSGSVTADFDLPDTPVDLYLSGSGDLRFAGRSAALGAFLSGSGDIRVSGETSDVELASSGSGDIRARDLSAESALIELDGSGDVSAHATQSVSVRLSGSGQVDLYGDAAAHRFEDSGSGDIVTH